MSPGVPAAVPAACLVACLAFVGCSKSDDKGDAVASSSTTAPAVTSTTRFVDTRFTGEDSGEFCKFIADFSVSQQQVSANATAASLEIAFRDSLAAIDQAVEVAPAEIKADAVRIADTFKSVQAAAAAVGFEVTKMSAESVGMLLDQQFLDSVTRMQAYLTNVCKAG